MWLRAMYFTSTADLFDIYPFNESMKLKNGTAFFFSMSNFILTLPVSPAS